MTTAPATASFEVELDELDLRRSMVLQQLGAGDPTARSRPERFDKAFGWGDAVVQVAIRRVAGGAVIEVEGPRAGELVDAWRPWWPPDDGRDAFAPAHPVVRRLHLEARGLRLVRVPWLWDVACGAVLQQRVAFGEACRGWRAIVAAHGGGRAFPSAARVARIEPFVIARCGIDPQRARALVALAREEVRAPFLGLATPRDELRARLAAVRGIGPWTTETILGFGAADPDAVPVGDVNLPHTVCWALARERPGSDARMLALLEPFRGHRFRVIRLIVAASMAGRFR